jgi:sulfhydrogenase subunit beta (sulfur reductase)
MDERPGAPPPVVLDLAGLQTLIDVLADEGYTVLGPTVRDGALVPGPVAVLDDLPRGWGDEQDGGRYRLHRRDDDALFGYAADAVSWKAVLFPAREQLWRGTRDSDEGDRSGGGGGGGSFTTRPGELVDHGHGPPPYALLGVRSCDVHALAVHDRVLRDRVHADAAYAQRRDRAFVVTVTCAEPSGTCFCVSMGTGPRAESDYDLALTELLGGLASGPGGGHRFVVQAGSDRGADVLARVPSAAATGPQLRSADGVAEDSAARMGRQLDTFDLRDLLYDNAEHPRWDDVARRCLSCGNCTMVCPTCFCTAVEDQTSLTGGDAERWRVWDSCHTTDFSHLHGGSVRSTPRSRYRQWMTHKLASWVDQFGTSGCVGCGRCITWCPVGIDITQEVAAIRASPGLVAGPAPGSDR